MEHYETYQLAEPMPEQFNSSSLVDGEEEGTVLTLRSRSTEPELILKFIDSPVIRITDEFLGLLFSFDGNWDEPDKNVNSFIVHNSKWLAQFTETELAHYQNPKHYVFITINKIIEVIASEPPTVTQVKPWLANPSFKRDDYRRPLIER